MAKLWLGKVRALFHFILSLRIDMKKRVYQNFDTPSLKICYTNPRNIKPNTAVLILDFKVQTPIILGRYLFSPFIPSGRPASKIQSPNYGHRPKCHP